mgnify:FL=1
MKILLIFFFILVSCSTLSDSKVKKVYICGDHKCKNKKEINEYFENNISIEIYTLSKSSKKDKDFDLVELNMTNEDKMNLVTVDVQEKQIRDKIKKRNKISKLNIKKGENNIVNRKKKNRPKITLVRICKDLQECDIDNVTKIIIKKGNEKKYPDLTIE